MTNEAGTAGGAAPSGAARAVFLSYASEDGPAAQRVCSALRAAGIEVWFDRSELRGGDAWDATIRRQIKSCALFIPIISVNAHARTEGYFRLEWKLATDRSHLIAPDQAFLLPVVIDDTPQSDERLPDRFRELQWTHLPEGNTPPEFVERVSRLLSAEKRPPAALPARMPAAQARPSEAPARGATGAPHPAATPRHLWWILLPLAAAVVLVGGFALYRLLPSQRVSTSSAPVPGASAIPEKSIAVLPFIDMSEKKDQEYFSDGLTEELLDQLAQVPDLHVAARTSSFYFKGKSEDVAAIAQKLRVANVLEGSVRKAGSTIRVTAQLIRADNGYHLWSKTYDGDVRDVFKVQDEISGAVVGALKTALLPATPAVNSRRSASPEAYTQYLLGRQFLTRGNGADYRRAADEFRQATQSDPAFADAWAGLADALLWVSDDENASADIEAKRREALVAADHALTLQPRLAYGYLIRGLIKTAVSYDFTGAGEDFRRALDLEPQNPAVLEGYSAGFLIPTGRVTEAVVALRQAVSLDPLDARTYLWLGFALKAAGDGSAARAALYRSLEISPEQKYTPPVIAQTYILEGQPAAALRESQRSTGESFRLFGAALAQYDLGKRVESQQALDQLIAKYPFALAYQIAQIYAWRGDADHAFAWLDRAHAQRDAGFKYVKVDPMLRKIRGDPRFAHMLALINLQ